MLAFLLLKKKKYTYIIILFFFCCLFTAYCSKYVLRPAGPVGLTSLFVPHAVVGSGLGGGFLYCRVWVSQGVVYKGSKGGNTSSYM